MTPNPGAERYYFLIDEQNTVEALATVDSMGIATIQERYEYGDYGEPTVFDSTGAEIADTAFSNFYRFTGRRFEEEAEIYYYRTRYLDSSVGKFTTRDTIGIWGDSDQFGNGYTFAASNPTSRVDPFGTQNVDVGGGPAATPLPDPRRAINRTVRPGENPTQAVNRLGFETFGVGNIRYIEFEDGSTTDLRHFFASANTEYYVGEWAANAFGWVNEVKQWAFEGAGISDGDSGAPLGGNEDLGSNADGAEFSDEHLCDDQPLGDQVMDYLVGEHGEVTGTRPNEGAGAATGGGLNSGNSSGVDSGSNTSHAESLGTNGTNSGSANSNVATEAP